MAGIDDAVSNLKNVVTNLGNSSSSIASLVSTFEIIGSFLATIQQGVAGSALAYNGITTSPVHIVDSTATTGNTPISLSFHNPGVVTLYVYPEIDITGNPIAPSAGNLGGAFVLLPSATLVLFSTDGWSVFAADDSGSPLTVMINFSYIAFSG